jgi:hypothetical protein
VKSEISKSRSLKAPILVAFLIFMAPIVYGLIVEDMSLQAEKIAGTVCGIGMFLTFGLIAIEGHRTGELHGKYGMKIHREDGPLFFGVILSLWIALSVVGVLIAWFSAFKWGHR